MGCFPSKPCNNIILLDTISNYLPIDQIDIRIYHKSSVYFYGYQLNKEFLFCLLPFYYKYSITNFLKIRKGELVYNNIVSHRDYGFVKLISVDNSILNDFVKLKLKKKITTWVIHAYRKEDLAVEIIERYWKRYRWDYLKNLAEIKYNPSKMSFEID